MWSFVYNDLNGAVSGTPVALDNGWNLVDVMLFDDPRALPNQDLPIGVIRTTNGCRVYVVVREVYTVVVYGAATDRARPCHACRHRRARFRGERCVCVVKGMEDRLTCAGV